MESPDHRCHAAKLGQKPKREVTTVYVMYIDDIRGSYEWMAEKIAFPGQKCIL